MVFTEHKSANRIKINDQIKSQTNMSLKQWLVVISCVAIWMADTVQTSTTAKPPNIVMILADDMGGDDVSFRGSREFLTPNIDALAYHGRVMDRLYAPPMCSPSRSALLTGRYPIHTGMQHFVIPNEEPWALPTNITTMAEIFQRAGYSTNLVGKWHMGLAKREYTPTYRGFEYHYGYWGGYIDYYNRRAKMPASGYSLGYDFRRNLDIDCDQAGTYVTDLLSSEAERLIRSNNNTRPLFLLVSHLAPHTGNEDDPLQAPMDEVRKFAHIKNPQRRIYAAMVSKLDQSIGRVVRALDQSDMLDNTILVFYSDNGAPSVGQFSNTGSNWPLRGQKNTPWEGGVRVAGAIWSKLLQARGSIYRQPFYVGDWLPTLATAAGIALDPALKLDGIDLWSTLTSAEPEVEREIVHQLDDIWHVASYMRGDWKYINGTTLNGLNDNVMTLRELEELDPRDQRYAVEVRNSLTSRALNKYDEQRLTQRRIERLRREAEIRCGAMQRGCNALIEECLFDLRKDPCEQHNLVYERSSAHILAELRSQVQAFRRSAWPPLNLKANMDFDPARHDCTWVNILEEPPANVTLNCDLAKTPCDT